MAGNIKNMIRQEYIKCSQDPVYFLIKYCKIQHPQRGSINFDLYDFQQKVLHLVKNNDYQIILKSRQLGISTLAAGYSLWLMLFHEGKNVLCIATKVETAKNMVTKVKHMYENLPSWLQVPFEENNKLSLRLKNGSQIKASSAAGDAGRSEAVSYLIIDEAAFISNVETIWASAQQTLSTGGKATILSTPNGTGNWFHKMWERSINGENEFVPIKLKWDVHPERDQAWRDSQDELLGDPRIAAQECDCDFSSSGATFINPDVIQSIALKVSDPLEKRGLLKDFWIWKYPDKNGKYSLSCDVARGDGEDYSTVQIVELESNEQVAEYKGQLSPTEFGRFIVTLGMEWNNGLIIVENNSYGYSTLTEAISTGYSNIYYSPRGNNTELNPYFDMYQDKENMKPGIVVSLKSRPLILSKLQEIIHGNGLIINSKRTLNELKTFVWKNNRPEAASGYNDDLIIPLAISQYLREYALVGNASRIDMSKSLLDSISTNDKIIKSNYENSVQNPYNVQTQFGNHDISWLL